MHLFYLANPRKTAFLHSVWWFFSISLKLVRPFKRTNLMVPLPALKNTDFCIPFGKCSFASGEKFAGDAGMAREELRNIFISVRFKMNRLISFFFVLITLHWWRWFRLLHENWSQRNFVSTHIQPDQRGLESSEHIQDNVLFLPKEDCFYRKIVFSYQEEEAPSKPIISTTFWVCFKTFLQHFLSKVHPLSFPEGGESKTLSLQNRKQRLRRVFRI